MTNKRGRPTKLNQPATTNPDGTTTTTAQTLINRIQLGLNYQTACDSAGITRKTLHTWRLTAARLRTQQTQNKLPNPTQTEQDLIDFLYALEKAEAEAEANRLAIIARAAQGGTRTEKVTTRYGGDGETLERTVVEGTLKPEWQAAAWFLERRIPERYARRVEVTGAGGSALVPAAEAARGLAEQIREFQAVRVVGEVVDVVVGVGLVEGGGLVELDGPVSDDNC